MKINPVHLVDVEETKEVFNKIRSVMLIDDDEIDNFINRKVLEQYGITDIISFKSVSPALSYLKKTDVKYQLILTDIYLPMIDGFEFIDKFNELELHKTQGEICLLSASINSSDKDKAEEKNIKIIEKPFTIEKLFISCLAFCLICFC